MPLAIKKVFPILALSAFSSVLGVGIIAPLLPLYAEGMGATGIWIGIIFASFSVSRAIVMLFIGRLSDRKGRKPILVIGLLVFSINSLGYIWVNDVAGLILVRLLQGFAGGMIIPVAQAYIGDLAPEGEEGKWMGYFSGALFTGFGTGPLMGGLLAEHFGMDIAFYTMAGLNLIAFLAVALFLPDIRHQIMAADLQSSLREIAASGMIRGLFAFRLAFAVMRGTFSTFLPILAGIYVGLSPSLIGILLAVNALGMSLLQAPGGRIADRLNRRILVVLGCLIVVIVMVLLPSAGNFWQIFAICVFLGVAGAIAIPSASALNVVEGRKFGMGVATATFFFAFSVGMSIGPVLSGVIADYININSVFYFTAVVMLVGTGIFSWFTR